MHSRLGGSSGVFAELDEQQALKSSCLFLKSAIETVRANEGDVVNRFADGVTACFQQAGMAVRSALLLAEEWKRQNAAGPTLRIVLHRGPVTVTSIDGQTHHTGAAISQAARVCNSQPDTGNEWQGVAMTEAMRATVMNETGSESDAFSLQEMQVTARGEQQSPLFLIVADDTDASNELASTIQVDRKRSV
jgi:hypothetical protein